MSKRERKENMPPNGLFSTFKCILMLRPPEAAYFYVEVIARL